MRRIQSLLCALTLMFAVAMAVTLTAQGTSVGTRRDGKHLFEKETFGGNGRTCLTCHSRETGTVSPEDAQRRFDANPGDPLFVHDGSDDFQGNGVDRMLADATVLINITLPSNVRLADQPDAKTVMLVRGVPTTLNTPSLDSIFMLDGRQPTLEAQAAGAIGDHAQATSFPTGKELERIKEFQLTDAFFSSPALRSFARGGPAPVLPPGVTESEKRGRRFFEDVVDADDAKHGLCAACHSGKMLNETNLLFQIIAGVPPGTRFSTALVSELDTVNEPRDFIFTLPDDTEAHLVSADPGRALITGDILDAGLFKIPSLWGIPKTAPYFHNNSSKTLEAVAEHYTTFFLIVTDPDGPFEPEPPGIILTPEDRADMVAYMKLLR